MEPQNGHQLQPADDTQNLIQEARDLAKDLATPGNARFAGSIQERLLSLQKSPAGWMIADGFLGSDDPGVRFYGPLTLTMKIHQDWHNLDTEQRRNLLVRLVDCFVLLVNRHEIPLVMRKFFSTMTAFFFKRDSPWRYCVRHIAVSLANGKYLPEEKLDQASFEALALPSLSYERLLAVLSFCVALAEESLRYITDGNDPGPGLEDNIQDVFCLINYGFQRSVKNTQISLTEDLSDQSTNTAQEALSAVHAWLYALHTSNSNPPNLTETVATSLNHAMEFLTVPSIAPAAMELFTETLTNQPKLISAAQLNAIQAFLTGPLGDQYVSAILGGDYEEDMMRFLDLLLRYAITEQLDILIGSTDEKHEKVLFLLYKLFHGPGFVQVEDRATTLILEYWTEAAGDIDELVMEGAIDVTDDVKRKFAQVIPECYDKLQYPSPSTLKSWDDDDVKLFNAFRRDFTDYLIAVYPLLGVDVVRHILEQASTASAKLDWDSFEVALFCLSSLADSIVENRHADPLLHSLFHSDLFQSVCYNRQEIPLKVRQTLADVITKYTSYFERNQKLLAPILNFLFVSLEFSLCDQAASRSISTLCQGCRNSLPMYVEEFIGKFHQLRSQSSLGTHTLERIVQGIAAVVQAVPQDNEKAICLLKLLEPLQEEAVQASKEALNNDYETGLARALMVIRCTASIGRGVRAPEDNVIDLDGETANTDIASYWVEDPLGMSVPAIVVRILEVLVDRFPNDGDMIEGTCDVLKAGYTERLPGPFVLPSEVTVRFVKAADVSSSRFPVIMATASAFLASHTQNPSSIEREVVDLIHHVVSLMQNIAASSDYDPGAAHSCIDFVTRLLPKYHQSFFSLAQTTGGHPAPLPSIFNFTLNVLKGPDPLPLRASCAFWSTVLSLPDLSPNLISAGAMSGHGQHQNHPPPGLLDEYLGPLGKIIMEQVAGRCARSDIEHYSEVIKRFIFKHQGAARFHLGNGLASMNALHADRNISPSAQPTMAPSEPPSVSQEEMQRFLSSILSLRGTRQTTSVVRKFWVSCRGKGFAYA